MKVERWMKRPPITVSPEAPALLTFRRMLENEIRHMPVVNEDGELLGIVTDRDLRGVILPSALTDGPEGFREFAEGLTVSEIMTRDPITVKPGDSVSVAATLMHNKKISGLPVVEGGRCVGVITVQDLMEILVAALDRHVNEVNEEIREKAS